jgi:DNA invertase Pin-like site-specific DNA recombinase
MSRTRGYARTSTERQDAGLEAQVRDLIAAGCKEADIYKEKVSSLAERDGLDRLLADLQPGDTLMITKPDRLARNTIELLAIEADLTKRGVWLVVMSMGGHHIDTRNPTSKLLLTILAGVAEWETAIMKERQKEGIAKAKRDGKYTGRKPVRGAYVDSVYSCAKSGMNRQEIADSLQISLSMVGRCLADGKASMTADVPEFWAILSGVANAESVMR